MISPKYRSFIKACQQCIVDCQICLTEMATQQSRNDCPKCCVQCIDACYIAIKLVATDSKWAAKYVELCAEICEWCASECVAHDHEHCQKCAASCRKCVEAYQQINN